MKVNAYIDGFNLYHSLFCFNDNSLKWLDLRKLCECFLRSDDKLQDIYYFSAYATFLQDKYLRHQIYIKALKTTNVKPIMGKFKKKYPKCKQCKQTYQAYEEKQSDINIALTLLEDAFLDKYDKAFLLTADTDLVGAVKKVKEKYGKQIILLIPPKRAKFANELKDCTNANFEIKKGHLKKSRLEEQIGNIICPKEYKIL